MLPAKLLEIHIAESDRYQGQPLYEAIVGLCRAQRIAGATVFRGLEGYGASAEMRRPHLARHDQPIIIAIIDHVENLQALIPRLEAMIDTGVLALADVEVRRVQRQENPG